MTREMLSIQHTHHRKGVGHPTPAPHPAEGEPIGREPSYVTEKRHRVGRKELFLTRDDPHRNKSNSRVFSLITFSPCELYTKPTQVLSPARPRPFVP
jgi:hypothetical protein